MIEDSEEGYDLDVQEPDYDLGVEDIDYELDVEGADEDEVRAGTRLSTTRIVCTLTSVFCSRLATFVDSIVIAIVS